MNYCSILSAVEGSEPDGGLQQRFSPSHMHTCSILGVLVHTNDTNQQQSQLTRTCLTHQGEQQTIRHWLEFGKGSLSCLPKSLALPLS